MTCARFSLNSRNRSASGASPQVNPRSPHRSSTFGVSTQLEDFRLSYSSFMHVHPLIQFLNALLVVAHWYSRCISTVGSNPVQAVNVGTLDKSFTCNCL